MEKKMQFTVKDLVYIITLVVGVLSSYFAQQSKIDVLTRDCEMNKTRYEELNSVVKDANLEVIKYRVNEINTKMDKLSAAFEQFANNRK